MSRFINRSLVLLPFSFLLAFQSLAQTGFQSYKGFRIAVFNIKVLRSGVGSVLLKCTIANTGELETGLKRNAGKTVVELDTSNLPPILWGHELALSEALSSRIPRLKPGEISAPFWLKFSPEKPAVAAQETNANYCPDLVIDTAYLFQYSADEIVLRFHVTNRGNTAVEIASNSLQLGVNVYFVNGSKLTRGAIPAGSTAIMPGRETLTGWLNPGQSLEATYAIDLKNRTKFAPNLLLELAPPSSLRECDKTNNTYVVPVKY